MMDENMLDFILCWFITENDYISEFSPHLIPSVAIIHFKYRHRRIFLGELNAVRGYFADQLPGHVDAIILRKLPVSIRQQHGHMKLGLFTGNDISGRHISQKTYHSQPLS
jgi:hypothetical protein